MIAAAAVRDAIARLVAVQESIEYGDSATAHALAQDLEIDLVAAVERAAKTRVNLADFNNIRDMDAA